MGDHRNVFIVSFHCSPVDFSLAEYVKRALFDRERFEKSARIRAELVNCHECDRFLCTEGQVLVLECNYEIF